MHQLLSRIGAFAKNPWLQLLGATVLLGTALNEVVASLGEEAALGVHHGAVLYGVVAVVRALPEALEFARTVGEVHELE